MILHSSVSLPKGSCPFFDWGWHLAFSFCFKTTGPLHLAGLRRWRQGHLLQLPQPGALIIGELPFEWQIITMKRGVVPTDCSWLGSINPGFTWYDVSKAISKFHYPQFYNFFKTRWHKPLQYGWFFALLPLVGFRQSEWVAETLWNRRFSGNFPPFCGQDSFWALCLSLVNWLNPNYSRSAFVLPKP